MNRDQQKAVRAAIRGRVAARQAPGVIGTTTAQALCDAGNPWSAAQIELWRDAELGWLNTALVEGVATPDPQRIARIGLALADTRVRDVVLVMIVRQARGAQVADELGPVTTGLPQSWRSPTATVAAWATWVDGRDPVTVLDSAAVGRGYPLAGMLRGAAATGVPAAVICREVTGGPLADYRYGTPHDELPTAGDGSAVDDHLVLGEALHGAGWWLHVSAGQPETGHLVGYLLRDHQRVAVVQSAWPVTTGLGQRTTREVSVTFDPHSPDGAAWRAALSNAGVTDAGAVDALVLAGALDLALPQAAARLATSPTVITTTAHLLTAGPTRGPRRT